MVEKKWSASACQEVIAWLRESILGMKGKADESGMKKTNFSQRQLYCRIFASVGLALRFGDLSESDQIMPVNGYSPYQKLSSAERKHLRRLLVYDFLPPALEMKDDRVTNVRLSLMKNLQLMPPEIRELGAVSEVLKELETEVETWESFNNGVENQQPQQAAPSKGISEQKSNTKDRIAADERRAGNGGRIEPIDEDPFKHAI
jgi:hypothetical protein